MRIVFDGQSLCNTPALDQNFPTRVMRGRGIPWVNVAVSALGWELLLNPEVGAPASRLFPQHRTGLTDILVMQGGQTDLFSGKTGAQTYTLATNYANAARAAGFEKVVMTTMPAMGPSDGDPSVPTAGQWTEALAHNVLVLANSGGFDAVCDFHQGPLTDATNPIYYDPDRLHFTAAGAQAAADLLAPVLDVLLASL